MKLKSSLFVLLIFGIFYGNAQDNNKTAKANYSGISTSVKVVPSLDSRSHLIPAVITDKEMQDGRSSRHHIIPGKGSDADDILAKNKHPMSQRIQGRAPSLVFDSASSTSQPTDPSGAVGPNHYVAVFNTGFRIFDKSGVAQTGQLSPDNIFSSGSCCDLTVSYDNAADRWMMSILYSSDGHVEVAVSQTNNPQTTAWNVYSFAGINDYQKISVWSDGYYMTANVNSASAGTSNAVFAMNRSAMLLGDPAPIQAFPLPGISTDGFYSPQAFNVTDSNLPATGSMPIVYLQDDAYPGIANGNDHVKLWEIDVDWNTPANSMITLTPEIPLATFTAVFDGGSFVNLTQPNGGSTIDALQATVMNQAQFRKFAGHNSAVFNFVVDTEAGAGELAGIRWVELRQNGDGQPWSLHQEGTYTSPDGKHAWHGSLAMDDQGNIGMGYTAMGGSGNQTLSSYYTGRLANDPLGTMTVSEELIQAGNANIPGSRYGDYGKIDVDPSNDKEFWFVNEYNRNGRKNVVGVFQIAPNVTNDVGVISIDTPVTGDLTNNETVTVTIFNYGTSSASGFDVTYQIDGGGLITEPFVGSIASGATAQHVFSATADLSGDGQTYAITAATDLSGDENATNDSITENVTHLASDDIGVIAITAPISGVGLASESIVVTIENFGTSAQSNFDVSYTINGGTPVVETVAGPLVAGGTLSYTFTAQGNFSAAATYTILSSTLLAGDADSSNDSTSVMITNGPCLTKSNTTQQGVGPDAGTLTESIINFSDTFTINDVNVTININHTWAADLDIFLIAPNGTTQVELTSDNGGGGDNFTGTVFDDDGASSITTVADTDAPFTGVFQPEGSLADFNGLSANGDWTLSITDDANQDGGNLISWSLELCGDETLSNGEEDLNNEGFSVTHQGNNQYQVVLNTTKMSDRLTLEVTNILGQKLLSRRLDNESGQGYLYNVDMSYVSSGVYIISLGNNSTRNTKRVIIK